MRKLSELMELLKPPSTSFWWRLLGERNRIVFTEDLLLEVIKLQDPSLHRIGFVRGSPLPLVIPVRTGERTFKIEVLEDGREFRLSIEDLYRHCYVIGQTGSGKTSFIKMLVHRLRELVDASIVVIDPHGDMALELAKEIPGSLYLHPIKSPFGLNPLDLPKHENRDFAVTIAIDILIEMFKEVLKLMETAVNVKYLLQVLLRAFYSKTDSHTLAMLYNAILDLYKGELDLDVDDEEWQRQLEALQSMQDQTFISALSRLEAYAHDKQLLKLTSRTTVHFEELMSPGSITIFSVPKADLGESLARLIASTIVMKLWFEVLARARLNKPRTPVFLVIDEFQFVADLPIIDTILSEARKYGLHLVIAHQHTKQIPGVLLQSIMSNCGVKVAFQVGGGELHIRTPLVDQAPYIVGVEREDSVKIKYWSPTRDTFYSAKLFMLRRGRLNTQYVLAHSLNEDAVSNVWWPLRLRNLSGRDLISRFLVFMNSTFVFFHLLGERLETNGLYGEYKSEYKKRHLVNMLLLDLHKAPPPSQDVLRALRSPMPCFDDYLDLAARLNQDKPLTDVAIELVEKNNEFSAKARLDLEVVRWLTEVFKLDVPQDFHKALRDETKTLRSIMEKSREEEEVIEDEPGMLIATKHRTLDKWSVKSK